jgi:hypothetical protein
MGPSHFLYHSAPQPTPTSSKVRCARDKDDRVVASSRSPVDKAMHSKALGGRWGPSLSLGNANDPLGTGLLTSINKRTVVATLGLTGIDVRCRARGEQCRRGHAQDLKGSPEADLVGMSVVYDGLVIKSEAAVPTCCACSFISLERRNVTFSSVDAV